MFNLEFKNTVFTLYLILPVLGLIIYMMSYRKKERIMAMLKMSANTRFKFMRIVLSVLALGLMVFSLMGPQILGEFKYTQLVCLYGFLIKW